MKFPPLFERLIRSMQRLQGIGRKSAERLVFDIIAHWSDEAIQTFAYSLIELQKSRNPCPDCFAPMIQQQTESRSPCCLFCTPARKSKKIIAVVATLKDLFALESTEQFQGTYFVLGNLVSPLDNRGLDHIKIEQLLHRIEKETIQEIVLALDNSPEGEVTAQYIRRALLEETTQKESAGLISPEHTATIVITQLATGVPLGSSFEYIDRSTLARAVSQRIRVG